MMRVPSAFLPGEHSIQESFAPSRALVAVGDEWSLRLIRDALFRKIESFADFQHHTLIPTDILTD